MLAREVRGASERGLLEAARGPEHLGATAPGGGSGRLKFPPR